MAKSKRIASQKSTTISTISRSNAGNKKHLVRLEKEKRQKNLFIILASIIGAVIVGLVTFGLIKGLLVEPQTAVAEVNGRTITVDDFRTAAVFRRIYNGNQYVTDAQVASYYTAIGFSAPEYLLIEIYTIKYEMETPLYFGERVIQSLIEDVLIEQEAEKSAVKVTDIEVSDSLITEFGYYPNGTPTTEPTATSITTPTFSLTQKALLATSTRADPAADQTSTEALSPTPAATINSSENTPFPTNTPEPTATVYTLEMYQENFKAYTEYIGRYNLTESDLFENQRKTLIREKMYAWITESVPVIGEQVWTQHILVATQEEADSVVERLNNGENWKDLASELSLDKDTSIFGGDQGWYPRGIMGQEIEAAAFAMREVGEMIIVSDSNGYHVLRLLGYDSSRPILDRYISILKDTAFSQWIENLKSNSEITIYDTWKEKVPENPPLPNIDISSIQ